MPESMTFGDMEESKEPQERREIEPKCLNFTTSRYPSNYEPSPVILQKLHFQTIPKQESFNKPYRIDGETQSDPNPTRKRSISPDNRVFKKLKF